MKAFTGITVCIVLFLPAAALSQWTGEGIEVRLASPRIVEVEPGKIVTGSFLVSNNSIHGIELIERLDLPEVPVAWEPVIEYERLVRLDRDAQWVELVTFKVPKNCPAGSYTVRYSLVDSESRGFTVSESFTVVVQAFLELEATIEDSPEFIMAGETYRVRMLVANKGNCDADIRFEAKASHGFPVTIDPEISALGPGSSRSIDIVVTTSEIIRTEINHILEIRTQAVSKDCDIDAITRTVFVEVLPRLPEKIDLHQRVPTRARFIAVGGDDEMGFQAEYSGGGSLDEEKTKRLDFMFRGPDMRDQSIYGMRDILRLEYTSGLFDLLVGDRLFSMSHLTELLTFGRGAEARLHAKGLDFGSFYAETRWDVPEKREAGGYLGYSHNGIFSLRSNILHKKRESAPPLEGYEGNIYSIAATVSPSRKLGLDLEYGYSDGENGERGNDHAHRISLNGQLSDRLWYIVENTYAGSGYLGYYRDVLFSNGTVVFPIIGRFGGSVSYRIHERNLDLDASRETAPRERSIQGTLSYPFASGLNLSFEYEDFARRDEFENPMFDFGERIMRIGVGRTFRSFGIQTYTEKALFDDHLGDDSNKHLERYSIYAFVRPSPTVSISAFARIGHNSFTGTPRRTANAGVSASLRLHDRIRMTCNYQKNNFAWDELPLQDYLLSTFDVTLVNGHSIALKARWFRFEGGEGDDLAFFAAYTIPFEVPAFKKRSIGVLKGRVLDGYKEAQRSRANVLLTAGGQKAVTDGDGCFTFPPLAPGTYALTVDRRSIGLDETTSELSPLMLHVTGGEETVREIEIVPACGVIGRVVLLEPDREKIGGVGVGNGADELMLTGEKGAVLAPSSRDEYRIVGGCEDVLVELSDGTEIFRQRTDRSGRFEFKDIRPGTWILEVYEHGLPMHHRLEKERFDVKLSPGEHARLVVNIVPRLRPIKIIDGGEIASTADRESSGRAMTVDR